MIEHPLYMAGDMRFKSRTPYMFEDIEDPDELFVCKECGVPINMAQYQRLGYCLRCERIYNRVVFGEDETWIDREVDQLCFDGWEEKFLDQINSWAERNGLT